MLVTAPEVAQGATMIVDGRLHGGLPHVGLLRAAYGGCGPSTDVVMRGA